MELRLIVLCNTKDTARIGDLTQFLTCSTFVLMECIGPFLDLALLKCVARIKLIEAALFGGERECQVVQGSLGKSLWAKQGHTVQGGGMGGVEDPN